VNDQLPMHIAASKGHRNSVEILLRESPDVIDAVDNSDQSPLVLASKHGFFDVVSFLLGKNADYSLKDKVGFTAFDWAVKRTFPDVVEVFLERDDWKEVNIAFMQFLYIHGYFLPCFH
jgi:ankyrin repeat protein